MPNKQTLHSINKRILSVGQNTWKPWRICGFYEGGESLPAALTAYMIFTLPISHLLPDFYWYCLILSLCFSSHASLSTSLSAGEHGNGEQQTLFAF